MDRQYPGVIDVAEAARGLASRLIRRQSPSDELGDAHVEVKLEFVVDVPPDARAAPPRKADQPTQTSRVPHGHGVRRSRAR
jgi:hypothetical protein